MFSILRCWISCYMHIFIHPSTLDSFNSIVHNNYGYFYTWMLIIRIDLGWCYSAFSIKCALFWFALFYLKYIPYIWFCKWKFCACFITLLFRHFDSNTAICYYYWHDSFVFPSIEPQYFDVSVVFLFPWCYCHVRFVRTFRIILHVKFFELNWI
jgi:hypothetical protein